MKLLESLGYRRAALYQDQWSDVGYRKPTGIFCNAPRLHEEADIYMGWPSFDAEGRYVGPLPARPPAEEALIGKGADDEFKTKPTAAYPPQLCMCFASLLFRAWVDQEMKRGPTPLVGGEREDYGQVAPISLEGSHSSFQELNGPIQPSMHPTLFPRGGREAALASK